ncbi:MAG: hypothetical protein AB3X44_12700 [Leptothrix sp. (in: b-proteobacteria)]
MADILDDAALIDALWLMQETMRGDNVSDIINYVDAVAKKNMLDGGLSRRLYTDFHKALRLPEDKLPLDPWPAMQAQKAARAPAPAPSIPAGRSFGGYMPPQEPVYAPPVPAPVPVPQPVFAIPAPVPVNPVKAQQPIEQPLVFGALMRAALQEVQRFHSAALIEVRKDALIELERSKVPLSERPAVRDAWDRAAQHYWQIDADLAVLAELVRVLSVALTKAFGRVGADQILSRAVEVAEQLPEARRYSPKRLMFLM